VLLARPSTLAGLGTDGRGTFWKGSQVAHASCAAARVGVALAVSSRSGSRWTVRRVQVAWSGGPRVTQSRREHDTSSRPCTGIKSNTACTYAPMLVCPRVENIIALYVVSDQTIYLAHSFT
jgi:hypothetical protein